MSLISFLRALVAFLPAPGDAPRAPAQYEALKGKAEESYAEKSFHRAHELYEQAGKLELPAPDRRWGQFRPADTTWATDASSASPDPHLRNGAPAPPSALIPKNPPHHAPRLPPPQQA